MLAVVGLSASRIVMAPLALADTKLEGYYEFLVDLRKQDRPYEWDFDSNSDDTFNQVEFRLLSNPYPTLEAFLKAGAEWNPANNNERPKMQVREMHLRYRREFTPLRGIESFVFSRQNRFWVENHLIQVVQDPFGGNGQGVRFDSWGFAGFRTALVYADFSGLCIQQGRTPNGATHCDPVGSAETDDGYIARAWRPFFDDRLRLGATYNRKNEREVAERGRDFQYTQVFAGDLRLTLRDIDYRLEIARGRENTLVDRVVSRELEPHVLDWRLGKFSFADPQAAFPDDIVIRGEARSFRFGKARTGFFNVAPSFWLLGPQFRNQLGDGNNDEQGFAIDSWYLVPRRAITLTNRYVQWEKQVFQQRKTRDWYLEMWTEYVNGFTTKFWYRRRRTEDIRADTGETETTRNDDLFGEVVVENQLAWMRVQGLIKDIDTPFRKELMSVETSVNISQTLKLYNRLSFGNDPGRQRKALFSELQFRPTDNIEVFLAYGPFWVGGGSNPVLEGNLQSSGDHRDLVRLLVRGSF